MIFSKQNKIKRYVFACILGIIFEVTRSFLRNCKNYKSLNKLLLFLKTKI